MIKKDNFIFGILFSIFMFNFSYAEDKIAFIDLNYVYSNSKIGKEIIKEIENKRKNINKDFKDFQSKLEKEKIIALENNLKKYNEIISKKNKDLIDYQNKSKNEFTNTLRSKLADYAKENSISLILSKEQILIGVKTLDVTKDILELVNKS